MAASENETRGAHLAEIRRTRGFAYGTAAAAVVALVVGIVSGTPVLIGVLPLVAVGGAFAIAYGIADRRARTDFWAAMATSLGMTYQGEVELQAFTPLLAAGDRRSCPEWLTGTLGDGRVCGVGNYTYEVRHRDKDGGSTWEPHRFTIGLIEVAEPAAAFVRGLYVRPRSRLRLFGVETLPNTRRERLQTESVAFNDRYDLYHDPDDPPARVLEVFSPTFIELLSGSYRDLCFDYRAGTLVVYADGHSDTAGGLQVALQATRAVAGRLDEEIAESFKARGAEGVRPA